jgi:Transposase IS116/IS110/IS902 family
MPASSWPVWPATPWASRAGRCWRRWWLGRPTPRCWPNWPAGSSARSCRRCARRWKAALVHHALLVGEMLARIDQLDESIQRLSVEVARVLVPFSPLVALPLTIPGRGSAHRGGGPGRDWPGHGSLSFLGPPGQLGRVCPGNHEPAGKHYSGRTRKGSKWLRTALVQAANAAARSKDTYLAAHDQRTKGRRAPQGHRCGRPLRPGDRLAPAHRQPAVLGP